MSSHTAKAGRRNPGHRPSGEALPDEARFALGTFTRIPVPPPRQLDRRIAGRGLAWAPLVGAALGLASGVPLLVMQVDLLGQLLSATIVIALASWLSRGLHWDGLADLADGLASGAPPERARAIMRRSDIGPFGVLVLVLVLLMQVLCLAQLPATAPAYAGWVLAMTLGRLAVVSACGPWGRAAGPDGLGALVVGAVSRSGVTAGAASALTVAALATGLGPLPSVTAMLWAPAAAVAAAAAVSLIARRRLGGLTGDVLGAIVELATLAGLLTLVLG
jgi:adenosylcobinamide-GDP ribazoletransferase